MRWTIHPRGVEPINITFASLAVQKSILNILGKVPRRPGKWEFRISDPIRWCGTILATMRNCLLVCHPV